MRPDTSNNGPATPWCSKSRRLVHIRAITEQRKQVPMSHQSGGDREYPAVVIPDFARYVAARAECGHRVYFVTTLDILGETREAMALAREDRPGTAAEAGALGSPEPLKRAGTNDSVGPRPAVGTCAEDGTSL